MRVMAQVAMVMNLDKCIGCHTCSVTCKNVWTNREGAEYMWFNNVETKPGVGYPRRWEDQQQHRGGWQLDARGRLALKSGGRLKRLASIFHNPDLPQLDDYYEPWTYDYDQLTQAGRSRQQPAARPVSRIDGRPMQITWGPNWEDDLAGGPQHAPDDPNLDGPGGVASPDSTLQESVRAEYEQVFMMYLPRTCNHCLNPACVASCPSGAMYKREEDGIVLVSQDACRGWRMCVSNCPFKKVFFNWQTGKAEKCTHCYPRIEAGLPTICSEACVGRIRYAGIVLYDADRVQQAASAAAITDLLGTQRDLFLDPSDANVQRAARRDGIPQDWIQAAVRSPVWALAMKYRIALPLHPEYRTLPMVWYVPPLSPMTSTVEGAGARSDPDDVFAAIETMRIPVQYLANLFAAGDQQVIRQVLARLAAMRRYMRERTIAGSGDRALAAAVGMSGAEIEEMYRLLAIARYEDRFVIPSSHRELAERIDQQQQGACGLDALSRRGSHEPEPVNGTAPADGVVPQPFTVAHVNGNPRLEALKRRRAAEREQRHLARRGGW